MLTESVAEASPSFPDVELGTFAARKDVNQITRRASELVLESELTARGVEGLRLKLHDLRYATAMLKFKRRARNIKPRQCARPK